MITHFGEETKKDSAESRRDTPNVVGKAGAGGAQQSGKQWRQVHSEERERTLAKANSGEPPQ